ncbi:disulfide bond formation protein B [Pseudohalioglobus lutimaris]|uniref:Disulfide bond formation protein B n=1 Tax=Pseudohalioglobus lutimaris TaxID=1737061 RepID=A0A2N5X1Z3_9GAMM|nr:disulfide bond formation protein B [Pseudohalioglobus lutimaris]PLW68514.1 disulfide bond formation protein B [Pseudohalioglobus lutimaris]
MLQSLTPRMVFIGLTLLAIISMAFAMGYLERQLNLAACPLCMTQRAFVVAWGLIALIAVIHNPRAIGNRIYAWLCAASALGGAAIAGRHVWLQHLPPEQVPACGPSLGYMLETLPFTETLSIVMMGDGNCAETMWTFMGLSIPEQTLILFVITAGICLWQAFRHYPQDARNAA